MDKASFMETLRDVAKVIEIADAPLSKEEILSYFKEYDLDDSQKEMIFNYLLAPHNEAGENESDEDGSTSQYGDEESPSLNSDDAGDIAAENMEDAMPKSLMFQMYLEELGNIKKYTESQLNEMCDRLCLGDAKVVNELSEALLAKVYDIAKGYLSEKYNLEDVIQEGNMALFLELTRICEKKEKCDVIESVSAKINEAMKTYISEITGEEDSENTVVGKVNLVSEARKYLTEQNGEIPSDVELAEFTKLGLSELSDIIKLIDKADVSNK